MKMNNIITNIELCKRNKERSNIYIDNEFAFAVSNEIIYKFHLKIKSNIILLKARDLLWKR